MQEKLWKEEEPKIKQAINFRRTYFLMLDFFTAYY